MPKILILTSNDEHEFFSRKQLLGVCELLPVTAELLMEDIAGRLEAHMDGMKQFDDITILTAHRLN